MPFQVHATTTELPDWHGWRWSVADAIGPEAAFLDRHAPHAFGAPTWLAAALRIERPQAIRIVTARDVAGEIVAVFPMAVRVVMGARLMGWLGQDWADYCGPIFHASAARPPAEDAEDVLRTVVRNVGLPVDGLCLRNNTASKHDGATAFFGLRDTIPDPDSGHVATLSGTWNGLLDDRIGAKARSAQRRKRRRLDETGAVEIVETRACARAAELAGVMIDWKRRQLRMSGALDHFCDPAGLETIRATLRGGGEGRIFTLVRDGMPLAITHCLDRRQGPRPTRLLYQTAITPEDVARFSPGGLLLDHVLEDSFAAGFAAFDFGLGDEAYKLRWADETVRVSSLYRALTPRGMGPVAALRAKAVAKRMVKERPALFANVKAMRAHLAAAFG